MQLIRRAVLRAATSPSTSLSKSRSIKTSTPFVLRPNAQRSISSSVFRGFSSDPQSADDEYQTTTSAVGSEDAAPDYAFGEPRREPKHRNSVPAPHLNNPRDYAMLTPTPGIYVGNLLFDITEGDLKAEFEQFGPVQSAVIALDPRGLSKGFGYVHYGSTDHAAAAIEAKNGCVFEGRRLIVNYMARTQRSDKRHNAPSKTLFIGNLAFEISDADLNKLFREIRNVIDVRVAIDRRTGQPRGFAHADFVDVDSAVKALEYLQGKEVYGRALRIDYSNPPGARNLP